MDVILISGIQNYGQTFSTFLIWEIFKILTNFKNSMLFALTEKKNRNQSNGTFWNSDFQSSCTLTYIKIVNWLFDNKPV